MPWFTSYYFITLILLVTVGVILLLALLFRRPREEMSRAQYRMFLYIGAGYIVVGGFLSFVYPGVFRQYFYLMIIGVPFFVIGLSEKKPPANS